MAQSNPNLTDIFTDVANAIREKKGTTAEIHPVDFADEIASITGGGDQPQLHSVTGLNQSVGIATWTGDSYTEAYKLYVDNALVDTVTTPLYDITTPSVSVGTHIFGVSAVATNFVDATPTTLTFAKYSITVNVTNGTGVASQDTMYPWNHIQITITPDIGLQTAVSSVINASYELDFVHNIITIFNAVGDVVVNVNCQVVEDYIIGVSGLSQSTPTLTRTDQATGARYSIDNGIIEFDGLDMNKIWGGYVSNDGEALTWDGTNQKYMLNGNEYTGNVFSKINKFYVKPTYVEIDNESVLDGFKLAYVDEKPDDTWQDWFLGKDYIGIGCYADRHPVSTAPLKSQQNINDKGGGNAGGIVAAYKLNSTTNGSLHELWYNEISIFNVLFFVLFATRQMNSIIPTTARTKYFNDGYTTGHMDSLRTLSTCATGYSTTLKGNLLLGIEDFLGPIQHLIGGIKCNRNGADVNCSTDYANFTYNIAGTAADISPLPSGATEIMQMRVSGNIPGLLLPTQVTSNSQFNTYYCAFLSVLNNQFYTSNNVFYTETMDSEYSAPWGLITTTPSTYEYQGARLCRTPA